MAVITANSTQITNLQAVPPVYTEADVSYGKLRLLPFTVTLAAAADIGSTINLVQLPAGKVTVLAALSKVYNGAAGAGATVALGNAAYVDTTAAGGVTQAAATASIDTQRSVAAAGSYTPDGALNTTQGGEITFSSRNGVVLALTVAGATVASGTTFTGVIAIQVE